MLVAKDIKNMLIAIADLYIEKEDELSKYDAVIGDGDHGVTMARGAKAARARISDMQEGTCRDYYKAYGRTLVSTLGGAMGPLFGSIFLELSKAVKGKETMGAEEFAVGFENGMSKIMELGGASVGDKTMLDSIDPVVISLKESVKEGLDLLPALNRAVDSAEKGVKATIPMKSKRGRSKYLQDKSIGHQDAGATSFYYLVMVIRDFVASK